MIKTIDNYIRCLLYGTRTYHIRLNLVRLSLIDMQKKLPK